MDSILAVDLLSAEPEFLNFKEPRNRFQVINSASLCSLAGRYNNPFPARFLAPIDFLNSSSVRYTEVICLVLYRSYKTDTEPPYVRFQTHFDLLYHGASRGLLHLYCTWVSQAGTVPDKINRPMISKGNKQWKNPPNFGNLPRPWCHYTLCLLILYKTSGCSKPCGLTHD
jgi:hypothetical protein